MLKKLIAIFNQNSCHPSVIKEHVFMYFLTANIIHLTYHAKHSFNFETEFQRFSLGRTHRSNYNGRSNIEALPSILINISGRAFCEENINLVCTIKNKNKTRQFGSVCMSPC